MNSINSIGVDNQKEKSKTATPVVDTIPSSMPITPTVGVPVTQQPQQTEDFTYQPKPGLNIKKISKIFVAIISLLVIILPLVYVFIKYNPIKGRRVEKKGEITWWSLGMNESVLKKMIEEYQSNNPKAKINLIAESEIDYRERLENSLKEGKGPDVFTIHNSWVPMFIDELDPIPSDVYNEKDFSADYYPVIVKNLKTSVGIVGIPLEYDALTLFINDEIFSYSGKVPPRTWDQFKKLATELTTKDNRGFILQSGAALGLTENVDYWPDLIALLMIQNKSNLYSPSGTGPYEAMSFFGDFFGTDKVWNSTLPASTIAFAEGKVAMFFAPSRTVDEIKKIDPNLKFRTITVPQVRRDDPKEPEIAYATFRVQSVWKKSTDKDLAWDFLKFLSTKESLEKMNQGLTAIGVQAKTYPRIDMRDKLINDRVLGSVVALAPAATSWYLADKTNDGTEGINTLVNGVYKKTVDTVSATRGRGDPIPLLKTLSSELKKVLIKFNVTN